MVEENVEEEENEPVEEGSTARRNLLVSEVLMKVHRRCRLRPREVDVLAQPLRRGDTVLERSFVEHVGGELGEARVHAVLDLETDRTVAEEDETLEEGLVETGAGGFLVHDGRAEL